MTAATLWASVREAYETEGLVNLTNPRANNATAINDDRGLSAAQEVIDLFGLYAQIEFDVTVSSHLAVGRSGVIAVLYRRGGTSSEIAKVEWDSVFGEDGLAAKLKRTSPRGRQGPSSNSGVTQPSELGSSGRRALPWSHPNALPGGRDFLPRRTFDD